MITEEPIEETVKAFQLRVLTCSTSRGKSKSSIANLMGWKYIQLRFIASLTNAFTSFFFRNKNRPDLLFTESSGWQQETADLCKTFIYCTCVPRVSLSLHCTALIEFYFGSNFSFTCRTQFDICIVAPLTKITLAYSEVYQHFHQDEM